MNYFQYKKNELYCEGIKLASLCKKYKTPLYVYSYKTIKRHFENLKKSWKPFPVNIAYAMKANSNLSILKIMRSLGSWVDTVSKGEMFRALTAGFSSNKIIFTGVGKSEDEIAYAIKKSIFMIVADSREEIILISQLASKFRKKVRLAIRVNPDVDPVTHKYISTGTKESKFGIPGKQVIDLFKFANTLSGLKVEGIHQHIGSQILDLKPYLKSINWIKHVVIELKKMGINIEWIDIGGGIGIQYNDEHPFKLPAFAKAIIPIIKKANCKLIIEPGRVIVGNAGVLVTKVNYNKKGAKKRFVIVDAAMNDLIRPAFYDAYHEILPLKIKSKKIVADVVGPVCESSDFLAKNRKIATVDRGDFLAVMSAGAYCFTMSSNYNSRPRAAEVLVKGNKSYLIRKRETLKDLIRGEK